MRPKEDFPAEEPIVDNLAKLKRRSSPKSLGSSKSITTSSDSEHGKSSRISVRNSHDRVVARSSKSDTGHEKSVVRVAESHYTPVIPAASAPIATPSVAGHHSHSHGHGHSHATARTPTPPPPIFNISDVSKHSPSSGSGSIPLPGKVMSFFT